MIVSYGQRVIPINYNSKFNGTAEFTQWTLFDDSVKINNNLSVIGNTKLGNAVTDTTAITGILGINSANKFSRLSVVSTTNGDNMFNFVSKANKNRSTYEQAIDTSSFNLSFTSVTQKPELRLTSIAGSNLLTIDSAANVSGATTITTSSMSGYIANNVAPMDSIFTNIISDGYFYVQNVTVTLNDDATYNFPSSKTVRYDMFVKGSDEMAIGIVSPTGVVTMPVNSGTLGWTTTDTDDKYNIYDGGDFGVLKNRSGATATFYITLKYKR